MSKKFNLFGDSDLFFARKLRPLADESKMRKFKGSKIIAGCIIAVSLYIPYWYQSYDVDRIYIKNYGETMTIPYQNY